MSDAPEIDQPRPGDEIRKTTCDLCACTCGIDVHLRDGIPVLIEGDRDHPVNHGVLCAAGAAGLMAHGSPARLTAPLRRTGPRGSGQFEEIGWDEALATLAERLARIRHEAPERLAFFTGHDPSQSFTSFWAQGFGTPNYASGGGLRSANLAAAGIYALGGAFPESGQPDWDRCKLFLLFGAAEGHDSTPTKTALGRLKSRGAKVVAINPVRTGMNAIADEWLGIVPGTDGLLILSLVHCLLRAGQIDLDYLTRFTDAPVILKENPRGPDHLMPLTDDDGQPLVMDRVTRRLAPVMAEGVKPDLAGKFRRGGNTNRSVFQHLAERYLSPDYAPEAVAPRCGLAPRQIHRLAADLAAAAFLGGFEIAQPWTDFRGERHETMQGRPVAMLAMRGIAAHSNGFQTARALHLLQILLGTIEAPGGTRFRPPDPKPAKAHPAPQADSRPDAPLAGPPLGVPQGPDDLCLREDGSPQRIDKGFTWENPLSVHGLMHMAISNAHAGDPYPIDTLILYRTNAAWSGSMNTSAVMRMLSDTDADGAHRIPFVVVADAHSSETVAFADLILPDTTGLERLDALSLLDTPISDADHAADALRWPVVASETLGRAGARGFQSVLIDLAARLTLPGFVDDDGSPLYAGYADYLLNHERRDGIGPLAGWRVGPKGTAHGRGTPNQSQLQSYLADGGVWQAEVPAEAKFFKPWNTAYQGWATDLGLQDEPRPYLFSLYAVPLRRFQLAAEGHGPRQPPEHLRGRARLTFDPLPIWYPPLMDGYADPVGYPLHAIGQDPAAMPGASGSQNAWLRQIHGENPLYLPPAVWEAYGFAEGDWARVTSQHGEITVPVALGAAQNPETVWTWTAIGTRRGAWALDPDAPEANRGFLLNHLIPELLPGREDGQRWANSDPITGQAAWSDLRVRVEKVPPPRRAHPAHPAQRSPVGQGRVRPAPSRRS